MLSAVALSLLFVAMESSDATSDTYLTVWLIATFTLFPASIWSLSRYTINPTLTDQNIALEPAHYYPKT